MRTPQHPQNEGDMIDKWVIIVLNIQRKQCKGNGLATKSRREIT